MSKAAYNRRKLLDAWSQPDVFSDEDRHLIRERLVGMTLHQMARQHHTSLPMLKQRLALAMGHARAVLELSIAAPEKEWPLEKYRYTVLSVLRDGARRSP